MSSRKKKYTVSFTTTAQMSAIMPIVQQLADAGSVENLSVDEVVKPATQVAHRHPAASAGVPAGEGRFA